MKTDWIYREIMYEVLERDTYRFTQKELSKKCCVSIGSVNYALQRLEEIGGIEKLPRGFRVINPKKILNYWASLGKLRDKIIYQTRILKNVEEIESEIPPNAIFTAYSAFKFKFNEVPSDYGEVVVYGDERSFEKRFGKPNEGKPNLVVLQVDEHLKNFKIAPIGQIYVDLWNLNTWYANTFLENLEEKINGILESHHSR